MRLKKVVQENNSSQDKGFNALCISIFVLCTLIMGISGYLVSNKSKDNKKLLPIPIEISGKSISIYNKTLNLLNSELNNLSFTSVDKLVTWQLTDNNSLTVVGIDDKNVFIAKFTDEVFTSFSNVYASWKECIPTYADYDFEVNMYSVVIDEEFSNKQNNNQIKSAIYYYDGSYRIAYTKQKSKRICSVSINEEYDINKHEIKSSSLEVSYDDNRLLFDLYRYIIQQ